jgi:DNA-binding NarL/FixJ family response regulator
VNPRTDMSAETESLLRRELLTGKCVKVIARESGLSVGTVRNGCSLICQADGFHTRIEFMAAEIARLKGAGK